MEFVIYLFPQVSGHFNLLQQFKAKNVCGKVSLKINNDEK